MKRGKVLFGIFSLCCVLSSGNLSAQAIEEKVKNVPYQLELHNTPLGYVVKENTIEIMAEDKTNLFNSPGGKSKVSNAPMILFEPKGDFTLSARVSGKLKAIYDVAALVVYQDDNLWAKLCYENSVKKQPTIVSVVTRTYSDDCNSMATGDSAYLSVVKRGNEYSFFYSPDGKEWEMVRNFHLGITNKVKIGFAAHGSRGDGFTGVFSEIKYKDGAIEDMRTL